MALDLFEEISKIYPFVTKGDKRLPTNVSSPMTSGIAAGNLPSNIFTDPALQRAAQISEQSNIPKLPTSTETSPVAMGGPTNFFQQPSGLPTILGKLPTTKIPGRSDVAAIGQGFLTPFGKDLPQLFRKVPGIIGGFAASGQMDPALILNQLRTIGAISPDVTLPTFSSNTTQKDKATAISNWFRSMIKNKAINPTGLLFLLGLARNQPTTRPRMFPSSGSTAFKSSGMPTFPPALS